MKQQRVVRAHLGELQKVVAVLWRLVVKGDTDVTLGGFEEHFGTGCLCI